MTINSILIIGGGNLGAGMAMRWQDDFEETRFVIAETNAERRAKLREEGLDAPDELEVPDEGFDTIVLAIKPQNFNDVLPQLQQLIGDATLVSVMAGIPYATLKTSGAEHIVRVMPNTPAMIGEGMSAIYAPGLSQERLDGVQALFESSGRIVMIDDEEQMHAITAISGSGPAYVFAFMEALEHSAVALGIDAEIARTLVQQTVVGAALLADYTKLEPGRLRKQVTSPGGTTEAALTILNEQGFDRLIRQATEAAQSRSRSMS